MSALLDRLAELAGIESSYVDYWGTEQLVDDETKRALLAAMGLASDDDEACARSVRQLVDAPWRRVVEPVVIVRADTQVTLNCVLPESSSDERLSWRITLENGDDIRGTSRIAELERRETRTLDARTVHRYRFAMPVVLPLGYHAGEIRATGTEAPIALIAVPPTCFLPPGLDPHGTWGIAAQLYSLRSQRGWGIGDFGDLRELVDIAASAGAGAIGLNPLHQLHATNPHAASPYGPSSRTSLNPLYIELENVPDLAESEPARRKLARAARSTAIAKLRTAELVDYERVAAFKFSILELLYASFVARHLQPGVEDPRARAFLDFRTAGGQMLERTALYDALAEHFKTADPAAFGWLQWPPEYRAPESSAVAAFARTHAGRIDFHIYLQWVAELQLAACAERCASMPVGLYRDLAVGVDRNGADVWMERNVTLAGASVGAPPDLLNTIGQNWGLPPLSPYGLRELGYAPFIALVRSNMRHAGALRIDHVMALAREFWIPVDRPPAAGAYVRYPFEDLLGIVALESRRNRCIVVGEDLGTVPGGFRERLAAAHVLSCRLLYFERRDDASFKSPHEYPRLALAATGTHDLPPLAGWWLERDVALRESLGLVCDTDELQRLRAERAHARGALIDALEAAGTLHDEAAGRLRSGLAAGGIADLTQAVYGLLAASPALLVLVQIEDILGIEQVTNVPGTVDEHPNWRRKLPVDLAAVANNPQLLRLAQMFREVYHR
ncbi:MAG: 4-alpha-glucanotransferase [Vulcanimicrobiaceae bacterium]